MTAPNIKYVTNNKFILLHLDRGTMPRITRLGK